MMRILLLLVACDAGNMAAESMDLSVGDLAVTGDQSVCPGPNIGGMCSPSGQACDYGATRCLCIGMYWQCNPTGCPDRQATGGSCSPDGLACSYSLAASYCVDGNWLACGDEIGYGCMDTSVAEGDVCCPNAFVSPFGGGCQCYQGRQCSCDNYHVHCAPCDM